MLRRFMIDLPAALVDAFGRAWMLTIAALTVIAFVTVGLTLLAFLLGVRLP